MIYQSLLDQAVAEIRIAQPTRSDCGARGYAEWSDWGLEESWKSQAGPPGCISQDGEDVFVEDVLCPVVSAASPNSDVHVERFHLKLAWRGQNYTHSTAQHSTAQHRITCEETNKVSIVSRETTTQLFLFELRNIHLNRGYRRRDSVASRVSFSTKHSRYLNKK
jgi:hypothetical protein